MRVSGFVVLLCCWVGLLGCDSKQEQPNSSVIAGEAVFQENCTSCHPRTGRGDYLKRIPATLLTQRNQQELMTWIQGSEKHREMPSFDHLSDEELQSLADYLHSEILK